MSPSGLNFTQVNPLIQQLEKRVKSSDLQAPRFLWERSNCLSLNSECQASFSLLLITVDTPSAPQSERGGGRRKDGGEFLPSSKYVWALIVSSFLEGRGENKDTCIEPIPWHWEMKQPDKLLLSFISYHSALRLCSATQMIGSDYRHSANQGAGLGTHSVLSRGLFMVCTNYITFHPL